MPCLLCICNCGYRTCTLSPSCSPSFSENRLTFIASCQSDLFSATGASNLIYLKLNLFFSNLILLHSSFLLSTWQFDLSFIVGTSHVNIQRVGHDWVTELNWTEGDFRSHLISPVYQSGFNQENRSHSMYPKYEISQNQHEACHGEGSREKMKEDLAKDLSLLLQSSWYQRHSGSCHKGDESPGSSLQPS